jgi:hypothetical protein
LHFLPFGPHGRPFHFLIELRRTKIDEEGSSKTDRGAQQDLYIGATHKAMSIPAPHVQVPAPYQGKPITTDLVQKVCPPPLSQSHHAMDVDLLFPTGVG